MISTPACAEPAAVPEKPKDPPPSRSHGRGTRLPSRPLTFPCVRRNVAPGGRRPGCPSLPAGRVPRPGRYRPSRAGRGAAGRRRGPARSPQRVTGRTTSWLPMTHGAREPSAKCVRRVDRGPQREGGPPANRRRAEASLPLGDLIVSAHGKASKVMRGGVWVPGGPPGLQNQRAACRVAGGFDSRPPPPPALMQHPM